MKYLLVLGLFIFIIQQSVAPPVNKKENGEEDKESNLEDDPFHRIEYKRYAREVIDALETDPHFIKVLNESNNTDIKSGRIAHELDYVNHHVRNRLDEIKREEIERLRHAVREMNMQNEIDGNHNKGPEHLDHKNIHSFEKEDLQKLIFKLHEDMEKYDAERKKRFKEYEMEKKFEQDQKMQGNTGMNEDDRKKYEKEVHDMEEKHKKHDPLHHPGSKKQFEEVWKEEDHMNDVDFNPKVFFHMHDLDGNGFWDPEEVNAIFRKELDKLYSEGHPEDDFVERVEEMERMREHFMKEADTNKDTLISFSEYMEITKNPEFDVDPGWETIDQQKTFSQEEYEEFQRQRVEEIKKSIGNNSPSYPPVNSQQHLSQYEQVPHQGMPHQQVPYHGQPIQQPQYQQPQYHQPQYQQVPGQVPPQGMPHQQVPYHGQPVQQPQYQHVPGQQQQYQQYQPNQQQGQVNQQQQQYQPNQQQQGQVNQQQQQQYQPNQQQGQINQQQQQYQPNQQQQGQVNQQQQQGQFNQPQQGQVNQQPQQGQVNQQPQQGQVNQPQGQVNHQQPNLGSQQVPVNQPNPPVVQGAGNLQNSIPDVKKV